MLLEWLSDAEMKLRFAGPLPDDEETTKQQIADHQNFLKDMIEQEVNKDRTIAHAQEILKKCHPDGVSVIRHWITIIQSRWEEVINFFYENISYMYCFQLTINSENFKKPAILNYVLL